MCGNQVTAPLFFQEAMINMNNYLKMLQLCAVSQIEHLQPHLRVCTHLLSRVESIRLTKMWQRLLGLLKMAACKSAYNPAESGQVKSHEYCRVKILMLHISFLSYSSDWA